MSTTKTVLQVNPLEMVNISKWIHVPYKIARAMMPDGFTERFRLHDENFLPILLKEIKIENIPATLGGKNEAITFNYFMYLLKSLVIYGQTPKSFLRRELFGTYLQQFIVIQKPTLSPSNFQPYT